MAKLKTVDLAVSVRVLPVVRVTAVIITLLERHLPHYEIERVLRTAAAYFNLDVTKKG